MKAKMNIRSIITIAMLLLASMFFINICFAANTGKIITETARLREQPQTDSKVLELTSMGEDVEILEETDGWYKVKYKNIVGYLRKDLVEVKNKKENVTNTEINISDNNVTTENSADTQNPQVNEVASVETTNEVKEETEKVDENPLKIGKFKIAENIKLKIIPLISSISLNDVNKDTEIEVVEVLNDWAKIKLSDGKEGWTLGKKVDESGNNKLLFVSVETSSNDVKNQNEATTEKQKEESAKETENKSNTMYVSSSSVNLRQKADKTSKVVKQLTSNTQVTVLSSSNGWAYVDVNGTKGYVAENLLSNKKQETSRSATMERDSTKTEANNIQSTAEVPTSKNGSSVVEYAKKFLGCKYVYGGTTTKGFDCSGFTQYVYKNMGVQLNRTAAAQYSNGSSVSNLQAGDLVMFGKSGINHVGIYIGGNSFIHAANPGEGVKIDSLSSGYYQKNYVGARRVIQ